MPKHSLTPVGRNLDFSDLTWELLTARLGLSRREAQVTRLLLTERTLKEIAGDLGLSSHTVTTYLERLYRKLHVATRVGLTISVVNQYLALITETDSPLTPICPHRAHHRCPLVRLEDQQMSDEHPTFIFQIVR